MENDISNIRYLGEGLARMKKLYRFRLILNNNGLGENPENVKILFDKMKGLDQLS